MSLIFIFIDGVGLAPAGPDNPLASAATPYLRALLGGPLTIEQVRDWGLDTRNWESEPILQSPITNPQSSILFKAIDATLGVEGLPQSGTGQTALLAGVNAAELHGRHQPRPTSSATPAAGRAQHLSACDRARLPGYLR